MREYTFLFKQNNTDDGDCVAYVDLKEMKGNPASIGINGSCYSKLLKSKEDAKYGVNYSDITTVLTEEEFNTLCNPLGKDLTTIINKLKSEENIKLFEQVVEEEKEYMMDEHNLDEKDIEQIFNEYGLSYKDRSIIGCIYDDVCDLGYEEAFGLGYINNNNSFLERYFDFEKFGEDLLEDDYYLELSDGRCVYLHY